jgi:hypothetical protein
MMVRANTAGLRMKKPGVRSLRHFFLRLQFDLEDAVNHQTFLEPFDGSPYGRVAGSTSGMT